MKNNCILNKLRRAGIDLEAGQKMAPVATAPPPDFIDTGQITKKKTRKKRTYFGNAQGKGKLFGAISPESARHHKQGKLPSRKNKSRRGRAPKT